MIKAVFFDLDGTLYDRDATVTKIAEDQFTAFKGELLDVNTTQFIKRIVELDDHGYGNKSELYEIVARECRFGPGLAHRLLEHFWWSYDRHCVMSKDTLAVLDTLRLQGKKLGVITNGGTRRQQRKLECLGLGSYFDLVLISEAEGMRKPDPMIFTRAAERCNVQSGEAAFVGDHPEVDVAGALSAGLLPIWKRVPYWRLTIHDVVTVDNLSEILPLCLAS